MSDSDRFTLRKAREAMAARFEASYGWERERALQVAEVAAHALMRRFGGKRHYIPTGNSEYKKRILSEYNGRNVIELSRIYGVSARQIRRYLKDARSI